MTNEEFQTQKSIADQALAAGDLDTAEKLYATLSAFTQQQLATHVAVSATYDKIRRDISVLNDPVMQIINKQSEFAEQLGLEFGIISMDDFELADKYAPVDNPMMEYEGIQTPVLGDTVGDLMKAADLLIKASGDTHHVYIEAVPFVGGVFQLCTGS